MEKEGYQIFAEAAGRGEEVLSGGRLENGIQNLF